MTLLSLVPAWLRFLVLGRGRACSGRRSSGPDRFRFRPCLEWCEERLAPATFLEAGATLNLVLGTNAQLAIVSTGTSYNLSLGGTGTWSGTNSANVSGNTLSTLTVTSAGISAFTTGITIGDAGSGGGDAVALNDSSANAYTNNFAITLANSSNGPSSPGLSFTGNSTFSGGAGVNASVNGNVSVTNPANLNLAGGTLSLLSTGTNTSLSVNGAISDPAGVVTLQSTGAVTVGAGVTISSGPSLTLAADVKANGSGDDGVGTLTVGANATLLGSNITMQGADEDVASTATVGDHTDGGITASTFVGANQGLNAPRATAFDSQGNLYVGNAVGGTVTKITPGGVAAPFLSGYGLTSVCAIAVDANNNIYVANTSAIGGGPDEILKVTPAGVVTTFATSSQGLSSPNAMAFDANGNLYVANLTAANVLKFTPGGTVSTLVPSSIGFTSPVGLTCDSAGNLYVTTFYEGTNMLVKVTPTGVVTPLVVGLRSIAGVAIDSRGTLYLADYASNTISSVTPGGVVSVLVGAAQGLSTPNSSMAFDSAGNLYVGNTGNNTVTKMTLGPGTNSVTIRSSLSARPMSLGGSNNAAVAGINLTSAELARIFTVASGAITIGDSSQTGNITFSGATTAATAGAATVVVQSTTGAGQIVLDDSNGTALNGNGGAISLTAGAGGIAALSAADTTAEIGATGATVTLNATGSIGTSSNPIQFADNSNTSQQIVIIGTTNQASAAYLDGLGSLTLGSVSGASANTTLAVTARTNLVAAPNATINTGTSAISLGADLKANGTGDNGVGTLTIGAGANVFGANITLRGADVDVDPTASVAGSSPPTVSTFAQGLSSPFGLAFDGNGNLYVANESNGTVSKVTPGGAVSTFVTLGVTPPTKRLTALAFDTNGNLYVASYINSTISKVTPGGIVSTFVSSGLNHPNGLAFDTSGNLYVANAGNNTISEVTSGGLVSTFATGLSSPAGLVFDASGNLYVANTGNNTISKVTPGGVVSTFAQGLNSPVGLAFDSAGILYATNGDGTIRLVTPGGVVGIFASGLSTPQGLVFASGGHLYVANTGNNTISKVTPAAGADAVTIRSSLPSRPMSLGGANNAAVAGINLTSTKLARIVTGPTDTIAIGDPGQTGNITFSGAVTATTPGAGTVVLQSTSGAGQIILDNSNGTALNGHGGNVSLTAGAGGITTTATTGANIQGNAVALSAGLGGIGSLSNPIRLSASSITAATTGNAGISLFGANASVMVGAAGLSAGVGTETLAGGTFVLGGANRLGGSDVTVAAGATLSVNTTETIGALNGAGTVTDTTGSTLTVTRGGTFSGALQDGAGPLALIVSGAGKVLILSGSNTYTGATTVSAGTLGGTGSVTSVVTVNSGGSITGGGLGTVGTFTVGGLTFNGGAFLADFNGITSDSIVSSGAINLNGGTAGAFTINSQTGTTTTGTTFTLLRTTGTLSNAPLTGAAQGGSAIVNGQTGQFAYTSTVLTMTITAPTLPGGTATGVQIDDGTGQRSMVRSLTITFSSAISASLLPVVMAQLSLTQLGGGAVGLVGTLDSTGTVLTLKFTGSTIIGGSLQDGRYTLALGGTTLLNPTQLWRLFGDLYGTGSVTAADVTAFNAAMNSRRGMSNYSVCFDYQEDGLIVNTDQTAFGLRSGKMLNASGVLVVI